eukprot:gene15967-19238_t
MPEELYKIHKIDARNINSVVTSPIVDVTITSPPYFDMKDYGYNEQIGYGQSYDEYLEDLFTVFSNVFDCTKDTGTLWVIIDAFRKNGETIPLPFDFANKIKTIGWKLKEIIIWGKDKTVPWSHKGQMRSSFEYILMFSKSENYNFYIDKVRDYEALKKWWVKYPERYNPRGKTPEAIWNFDIPVQGSWGKGYIKHFCPLPEEMIAQILKLTTLEGDVVLDPFSGSGAVLSKADNMKRKFIGTELNPEYINMFENYLLQTGTQKRHEYETDEKNLLTQNKFEKLILELRALKYARLFSQKINDQKIDNVSLLYVEITDKIPQRSHSLIEIRSLMLNMGFKRAPRIDGTQFIYEGRTSEMDDIFYFENIVLLTEYTVKKSVSSHLINKKVIYDKIKDDAGEFIKFLLGCTQFQAFSDAFSEHVLSKYSIKQLQIRVLYASKFQIPSEHKLLVNNIKYFDYPIVKYFEGIAKVIRKTAKHEFFDFLEIDFDKVADNIKGTSVSSAHDFHGHILPEEHSSFKEGYKLISFYIDADSLLKRSFVLRKEGWRNTDNVGLYQRMFVATKMRSLRKYLHEEQHETKVQATIIKIQNESSIIGIIDGQHRAYAYHEGEDIYEESIAKLRGIQNLLVTGILYPKNENEDKRLKFEAKLFLEINANQSGASSGLKQEIEYYLIPFSTTSIAKYVINQLNLGGPLGTFFERYSYEKDKIKTASIISFGLKPLIKFDGNDSLFKIWNNANKEK